MGLDFAVITKYFIEFFKITLEMHSCEGKTRVSARHNFFCFVKCSNALKHTHSQNINFRVIYKLPILVLCLSHAETYYTLVLA